LHSRSHTPVFCDQSGLRSMVLQWGGRGIGLLLLLLCAGLAMTLNTRVEVPGLNRLLPETGSGSELFDARPRRNASDHELANVGRVMVPETSDRTVVRERDLRVREPISAPPTVEPAAERSTATRVEPNATTPVITPSTAPSVQSSPTKEPSPTASTTARQRNPNAAVPRQEPNAQGSAANAPGQAQEKAKGKRGNGPSPKVRVEPPTP
jgi:hypothetical protein